MTISHVSLITDRCLYKHSSLVSHHSHNVKGIDGFKDFHLAEGSLHQDEHTSATDTSTVVSNQRKEDGVGEGGGERGRGRGRRREGEREGGREGGREREREIKPY